MIHLFFQSLALVKGERLIKVFKRDLKPVQWNCQDRQARCTAVWCPRIAFPACRWCCLRKQFPLCRATPVPPVQAAYKIWLSLFFLRIMVLCRLNEDSCWDDLRVMTVLVNSGRPCGFPVQRNHSGWFRLQIRVIPCGKNFGLFPGHIRAVPVPSRSGAHEPGKQIHKTGRSPALIISLMFLIN